MEDSMKQQMEETQAYYKEHPEKLAAHTGTCPFGAKVGAEFGLLPQMVVELAWFLGQLIVNTPIALVKAVANTWNTKTFNDK